MVAVVIILPFIERWLSGRYQFSVSLDKRGVH